ncbi:VTC domain-containing protein [Planctomicrobium sp. SH668]|uniref:VTC domain-containing protein n=1 Tax=Planctomicrobium sp. SH668 TaxID=3448126 RepID=UPI003F5B08BB
MTHSSIRSTSNNIDIERDPPPFSLKVASHLSPSLRENHESNGTFEIKFLLIESVAAEIEWHFVDRLSLDPHASPELDNSYLIRTLYLDTPAYSVFHREGIHGKRKLRIRTYGDPGATRPVFLEQKTKNGDRVRKQRSCINLDELNYLSQSNSNQV